MELTRRQEQLLNALIQEYISTAEPVGSIHLKKSINLDVCPATIRNDLQELTEAGYIAQPHTSAGRIPTEKAYRFFVEKIFPLGVTTESKRASSCFFQNFHPFDSNSLILSVKSVIRTTSFALFCCKRFSKLSKFF